MFDRTKGKVSTLINDRVVAPSRTAIIISFCALIIAVGTFIITVREK